MIDLHSHILHGIDDGPKSMEESLAICRIAALDGIKKIVATPHIYPGVYNNNRENILKKVEQLNKLIREEGISLDVLPGADVYFTPLLFSHLNDEEYITINNTRYLLIEFPQVLPVKCEDLIFKLRAKDYIPIISHPERNFDLQRNPDRLRRLIELGAVAQLTAMSLTGGFGYRAKNCAEYLLIQDLIQVIATDAHSVDRRPPILSGAVKIGRKIIGDAAIYRMVFDNPMKIAGIKERDSKKI